MRFMLSAVSPRSFFRLAIVVASFLFLFFGSTTVLAAECKFRATPLNVPGQVDNFFDTDSNWSCGHTPGRGDDAVIDEPNRTVEWRMNPYADTALKNLTVSNGAHLFISSLKPEHDQVINISNTLVVDSSGKITVNAFNPFIKFDIGKRMEIRGGGSVYLEKVYIDEPVVIDGSFDATVNFKELQLIRVVGLNPSETVKTFIPIQVDSIIVPSFENHSLTLDGVFTTKMIQIGDKKDGYPIAGNGTLVIIGNSKVTVSQEIINGGSLFLKDSATLDVSSVQSGGFVQTAMQTTMLVGANNTGGFYQYPTGRFQSLGKLTVKPLTWLIASGSEFKATGDVIVYPSVFPMVWDSVSTTFDVIYFATNEFNQSKVSIETSLNTPRPTVLAQNLYFTGKDEAKIKNVSFNIRNSSTNNAKLVLEKGGNITVPYNQFFNNGTITADKASGSVVHNKSVVELTDAQGALLGNIDLPTSVYVQVKDNSSNLDATLVEMMEVYLEARSAPKDISYDKERVVLTETGPSTGVFRSAQPVSVTVINDPSQPTNNNGPLEIKGTLNGYVVATYEDPLDPSDVALPHVAVWNNPQGKDLVTSNVSAEVDLNAASATIRYKITNKGETATNPFVIKAFLFGGLGFSKNKTLEFSDQMGLQAGETRDYSFEVTSSVWAELDNRLEFIEITADSNNAIPEVNEQNNIVRSMFGPSLDVDRVRPVRSLKKKPGTKKNMYDGMKIEYYVMNKGLLPSNQYNVMLTVRGSKKTQSFPLNNQPSLNGGSERRIQMSLPKLAMQGVGVLQKLEITITPKP